MEHPLAELGLYSEVIQTPARPQSKELDYECIQAGSLLFTAKLSEVSIQIGIKWSYSVIRQSYDAIQQL